MSGAVEACADAGIVELPELLIRSVIFSRTASLNPEMRGAAMDANTTSPVTSATLTGVNGMDMCFSRFNPYKYRAVLSTA